MLLEAKYFQYIQTGKGGFYYREPTQSLVQRYHLTAILHLRLPDEVFYFFREAKLDFVLSRVGIYSQ